MPSKPSKPELLAPAGSAETGLAALKAGADAIYLGLQRFNARERGRNCTEDELARLVEYARRKDKRVYLTLNTLIKEAELPLLAEQLCRIAPIRPHAVIVQDLGLLRLLRRHFPELAIHASTQMGLHNSAGIRLFEELGVERVILQRQTTLEELELILKRVRLEVEVFAHGALCCGRSGSCLFSSWLGGWSGNRGKCKQPCRRLYRQGERQGFFFSCQDLCLIDLVPTLARLGVAALKLEGRLRPTAYVQRVVQAYRIMLDAAPDDEADALREARRILAGALGRRWSHGFLTAADAQRVIDETTPGIAGKACGRLLATATDGITLHATAPFGIGDTLRVQPGSGEEGYGFTVRSLQVCRRAVKSAGAGEECFIACSPPADLAGTVYKVAQAGTHPGDPEIELPAGRFVVPLRIGVTRNEILVDVPLGRGADLHWGQSWELAPAQKTAATLDQISGEFSRGDQSAFAAGAIEVSLEPGLFLPGSVLKQVRRAFFEWLDTTLTQEDYVFHFHSRLEAIWEEWSRIIPEPDDSVRETIRCAWGQRQQHSGARLAVQLFEPAEPSDEIILPDFVAETQLDGVADRIRELIDRGHRRFRVTAWHGFTLLRDYSELELTAAFPLPVANSSALEQLMELGVGRAMAWVELEVEAIEAMLRRCPGRLEQYLFGRLPLLTTRADLKQGGLVADLRDNRFEIIPDAELTTLYHEGVYTSPPIPGLSSFRDLQIAETAQGQRTLPRGNHTLA